MQNKKFTKSWGISRSPTIKFFGMDKKKPDNFIGHRTSRDLIKYINAYADQFRYVRKEGEEEAAQKTKQTKQQPKQEEQSHEVEHEAGCDLSEIGDEPEVCHLCESEHIYDITNIVGQIKRANYVRIRDTTVAHESNLASMKKDHVKAQEEVTQNFDAQIAALIAEHKKAVAAENQEHAEKQASSKSALEERVGNMETEATEVINDIKEKNLDGVSLTSYVPMLD